MNRRTLLRSFSAVPLIPLFQSRNLMALAATPVAAPDTSDYAHPEWLASAEWLLDYHQSGLVKIVALTPVDDFAESHIPGAVQIDWPAFEITETSDQTVAAWQTDVEAIFTSLGIARDDKVVVYDGGTFYASRLWWLLFQLGHTDVRILNGGLPAWERNSYPLESGAFDATAADIAYVGKPDESAIAQIDEVVLAVGQPGVLLIDARKGDEFADGHIPGAVNIPFTDNAVADGPRYWKPVAELTALYAAVGVTPETAVIPYCTTGVRSAATYFALRMTGHDNVSLFSGSYKEWTSDPARPISVGENP